MQTIVEVTKPGISLLVLKVRVGGTTVVDRRQSFLRTDATTIPKNQASLVGRPQGTQGSGALRITDTPVQPAGTQPLNPYQKVVEVDLSQSEEKESTQDTQDADPTLHNHQNPRVPIIPPRTFQPLKLREGRLTSANQPQFQMVPTNVDGNLSPDRENHGAVTWRLEAGSEETQHLIDSGANVRRIVRQMRDLMRTLQRSTGPELIELGRALSNAFADYLSQINPHRGQHLDLAADIVTHLDRFMDQYPHLSPILPPSVERKAIEFIERLPGLRPDERAKTVRILGMITRCLSSAHDESPSVRALLQALQYPDMPTRYATIAALTRIDALYSSQVLAQAVETALLDPNPSVGKDAMQTLFRLLSFGSRNLTSSQIACLSAIETLFLRSEELLRRNNSQLATRLLDAIFNPEHRLVTEDFFRQATISIQSAPALQGNALQSLRWISTFHWLHNMTQVIQDQIHLLDSTPTSRIEKAMKRGAIAALGGTAETILQTPTGKFSRNGFNPSPLEAFVARRLLLEIVASLRRSRYDADPTMRPIAMRALQELRLGNQPLGNITELPSE